MHTNAIIMMVSTMAAVTFVTAYFFIKVLKSPQRPEPDSYKDNDPE